MIEYFKGLIGGEWWAWFPVAIVAGFIGFNIIYKKVTGREFVKSREERREAEKKRKIVLWEYKRD